MNSRAFQKLAVCGLLAVGLLASRQLNAQYLTLEGQTGGFLTPTAYVVYMEKGEKFSHPAVGFHFIDASAVIGNIETLSITEAFFGRAEAGYTRSIHQFGNSGPNTPVPANAVLGSTSSASTVPVTPDFSQLWHYNGMNVFHGKVVAINDGQFGPWTPGIAVGGVVRTNDRFVSGAAYQQAVELYDQFCLETSSCTPVAVPAAKSYNNGDIYVAFTKTWAKKPVPFLANIGWKATNASIYGIGGQSNRFIGRFFGGLGIPLPIAHGVVAVPSAGFTQQPPTVKGLGIAPPNGVPLVAGKADLPTTLDYAVRITQREKPHFAFDIGVGQVANNIGTIPSPTYLPAPAPPVVYIPVNLNARHVVGMGISYRY
ncbi:MAG: hypothetical protein ABSC76_03345 [Terracidiphilus sp.]